MLLVISHLISISFIQHLAYLLSTYYVLAVFDVGNTTMSKTESLLNETYSYKGRQTISNETR